MKLVMSPGTYFYKVDKRESVDYMRERGRIIEIVQHARNPHQIEFPLHAECKLHAALVALVYRVKIFNLI